jgi:hypothetical protein
MLEQAIQTVRITGSGCGIVGGTLPWHELMARMQTSMAIADKPAECLSERSKAPDFQENDVVSVQRPLLVGIHHIFKGSTGIVTAIRNGGKLFDVKFFCDPSIAITISRFDLMPAL